MGNFDDVFDTIDITGYPGLPPLKGKIKRVKKGPVGTPITVIPTLWAVNDPKERKKQTEESELLEFMQECRERTVTIKDEAKCDSCKLRFRCYTEIKVKKKRKSRVRKPKPDVDDKIVPYKPPTNEELLQTQFEKWAWGYIKKVIH